MGVRKTQSPAAWGVGRHSSLSSSGSPRRSRQGRVCAGSANKEVGHGACRTAHWVETGPQAPCGILVLMMFFSNNPNLFPVNGT